MKIRSCAFLFIILVFTVSCLKIDPFDYAEKITIKGTVSNVNAELLDGVEIGLYKSGVMYPSFYIDGQYSENGKFEFEIINNKEMWNYHLYFNKEGYKEEVYKINSTKKSQKLDVIMERAIE